MKHTSYLVAFPSAVEEDLLDELEWAIVLGRVFKTKELALLYRGAVRGRRNMRVYEIENSIEIKGTE